MLYGYHVMLEPHKETKAEIAIFWDYSRFRRRRQRVYVPSVSPVDESHLVAHSRWLLTSLVFAHLFCGRSVSLRATKNALSLSAGRPWGQPNRLGSPTGEDQLWDGPRGGIGCEQRRHFVQRYSIRNPANRRPQMDSSDRTFQLDWGSQCDILWS